MKLKTYRSLLFASGLCLSALPQNALAQAVLTKLADFNGVNGQNPTTGLVLASDGNFYGTTPAGGSGPGVTPQTMGVAYRITPAGVLTPLCGFTGTATGVQPMAALIQAADGNLYGTTQGGFGLSNGTIFRLTLSGELTTLYAFAMDPNNAASPYPHGISPEAALVQGSDLLLYGTTAGQGVKNATTGTPSFGTIFAFNPGSGVITSYPCYGANSAGQIYQPQAPLLNVGDGTFLSVSYAGGTDQVGNIYQFTSGGAQQSLYDFTNAVGVTPTGGLTLGADGAYYGTTESDAASGLGSYYRVVNGGFQELGAFNGAGNGGQPYGEMVSATDGNLYGTTSSGGADGLGTIYRLTTQGVLTTVYSFPAAATSYQEIGAYPTGTLVQGTDGRLYGTTQAGGTSDEGTVFALSLNPVITSASSTSLDEGQAFSYQITATNTPTHFAATGLPSGLSVNATTGLISGTLTQSGVFTVTLSATNGMGTGTATLNINGHPSFFKGETALSNGVYYLAFPSGHYFGYYSYLANPNYIYHFDLGYEYVFDANDGHSGVYLYDFKSSGFFYTSPGFPFPYLYDFTLNTVLYYYPDPNDAGRYNTNWVRYFYDFATGKIIAK